MRWTLCTLVAAAAVLTCVPAAHGQASQSEMREFPMPPPSGYARTKHFAYPGDYGYFAVPTSAHPGQGAAAGDYRYVRYTGVAGKDVWLYGAWGTTAVPAPVGKGDDCAHAHTSYGVWARYRPPGVDRWIFLGGGGMSGARNASGQCVFKVQNPLASFDSRFGWGKEHVHFDLRGTHVLTELVLGVLSNTHGWGSCTVPPGAFRACHEPSWSIGYTLP